MVVVNIHQFTLIKGRDFNQVMQAGAKPDAANLNIRRSYQFILQAARMPWKSLNQSIRNLSIQPAT